MNSRDLVHGWCYCRILDEWDYRLLYAKVWNVLHRVSQWIRQLEFYTSGFMSESRGLHWDRRR